MKMNKKGFTIVELVIVIAVIAILAGVLIPTFSGLVGKAQDSAVIQEARNKYTEYVGANDYSKGEPAQNIVIEIGNKYVIVKDAKLVDKVYETKYKAVAIDDAKYADGTDAAFLCDEHEDKLPEGALDKKCDDCEACMEHVNKLPDENSDGTADDTKCDNCGECVHSWTDNGTTRTCSNCKVNCIVHDWTNKDGKCAVCEEPCAVDHTNDGVDTCTTCGKKD